MAQPNEIANENKFVCKGCTRVFPDKREIEIHMVTCIVPKKGVTFSAVWKEVGGSTMKRDEGTHTGKVAIPSSQTNSEPVTDEPIPKLVIKRNTSKTLTATLIPCEGLETLALKSSPSSYAEIQFSGN